MICPICLFSSEMFTTKTAICHVPSRFAGQELLRHICPNCDVIFGTQEVLTMTPEQAGEFNFERYSKNDVEARENSNLERINLLYNLKIEPGATVLNWGSGPASKLAKKAREDLNISFDNFDRYLHSGFDETYGTINRLDELKQYDYIISTNVLEHFLDPVAELLIIKDFLKKDGKMVHCTPCFRYMHETSKMHTFFFLGRSTQILADRIDMDIKFLNWRTAIFTKKLDTTFS